MLRIVAADLHYSLTGLISAGVVLFIPLLMPLLSGFDMARMGPVAGMSMVLISPITAMVVAWQLLLFETDEKRLRLWAALPLTSDEIIAMRFVRLLVVHFAIIAVVLVVLILNEPVTAATSGSGIGWIYTTLFAAGLIPPVLLTLLFDLVGKQGAQYAVFGTALAVYALANLAPAQANYVINELSNVSVTPLGGLLAVAVALALAAVDWLVMRRRLA